MKRFRLVWVQFDVWCRHQILFKITIHSNISKFHLNKLWSWSPTVSRFWIRIKRLDSGSGVLDGFDLAADLFRGETVQPALTDHDHDRQPSHYSQHGRLELPKKVFLHHSRAAAGGGDGDGGRGQPDQHSKHTELYRDTELRKQTSCTRLGWIGCS